MTRRQISVLVVDDSDDHRLLMKRCLADAGMSVSTASTAAEALRSLEGVDLVLLDHRLPGMSGLEALKAIRSTNGPSVVMVTGMGSEGLAVEAMRSGAIDYLVKDVQFLGSLPGRVERAWRHHDLLRRTSDLQRLALIVTSTLDRDRMYAEIVRGARTLLGTQASHLCVGGVDGLAVVAADADGDGEDGPGADDLEQMLSAAADIISGEQAHDVAGGRLLVRLPSLEGEPLGALALVDDRDRQFLAEDVQLATAFACFAGLALQNLHRFELERALSAELVVRARQQAAVALLGQRALAGTDLDALMAEATSLVTQMLDVELAKVLQVQPDATMLLRAGAGWPQSLYGRITELEPGSQAFLALTTDAPVIVEDFSSDGRIRPSAFARQQGVLSSAAVTISGHGRPFGVLGADTTARRSFSRNDIDFLQSVANVLATAIDADRVRQELLHQALHDPLTGLPNRALLLDRLEQSLARARRHGTPVTVLFLDVDRFKVVNDSLGHTAGDQLLLCIADRLRATMRPSDTVGRFGGDEFVVLSEEPLDEDQAILLAEGVSASLTAPAVIGGRDIRFTVSTGIVVASMHDTAEALLRDADVAMYRAKERGRARHEVFNTSMRELVVERLETERALQEAIEQGQLRVVYQPEVSLRDGRVVAVEALVRWAHPERGLLAPADFMELAEDTGLVVPMDRWLLREACAQVQQCRSEHPSLADMVLWVNFSARQLADPEVAAVVAHCLSTTGCDPSLLGIEITESVGMEDVAEVRSALAALRQLGVQIAIDDFGTGFSSLSYLRSFPVSVLKIDRSFVAGMVRNDEDRAIVSAVVSLAHSLGLSAVAEGVETPEQLGILRDMGCELAQGFLFGKPAEVAIVSPQLACMAQLAADRQLAPKLAGVDLHAAPNVLVCDDDATIRRVYRAAFELEGATVWEASDGDECIAAAHAHRPDLVVLDIFMPRRSGLSALPELVRDLPGLRVVTVSAAATHDLAEETRILGAEECFEKTDFLRSIPNVLAGTEPVS